MDPAKGFGDSLLQPFSIVDRFGSLWVRVGSLLVAYQQLWVPFYLHVLAAFLSASNSVGDLFSFTFDLLVMLLEVHCIFLVTFELHAA